MANVYKVMVVMGAAPSQSWREEVIVTDTLQNALSIAKAHCKWNEEVDEVYCLSRDVTVDHAAIGTQQV